MTPERPQAIVYLNKCMGMRGGRHPKGPLGNPQGFRLLDRSADPSTARRHESLSSAASRELGSAQRKSQAIPREGETARKPAVVSPVAPQT